MPEVSVLIPAYNVEPYIEDCINSVLGQTLQDFEIVCIDDASTDGTLQILKRFEASDSRIKVYTHEVNKGQASGRNDALDRASGRYVYMLDADDRIVRDALAVLYEACVKDDLDIIGFETENFADEQVFRKNADIKTISYTDTDVMNGRRALKYCMETESFSLSTPTFMMKRDYLVQKNIRFIEGILHEDVGYIFELITRADRVRFIDRVLFQRRIRANSTMTRGFTDKNIEGYIRSFSRSFDLEPELSQYFGSEPGFEAAMRKWQRDIFGRLNQLYTAHADTISRMPGGSLSEEVRRAFEMVKLSHYRVDKLPIKECYLCGTGQYTERAIEAVGAQDIIIRGIISLDNDRSSFRGFPIVEVSELCQDIPVILSVSKYSVEEYRQALKEVGINELVEMKF